MTLLSRSFRPLTGALRSFFKPTAAAGSLDYYIRNRPTEAISSILASASCWYDDSRTHRRFPSLAGVGGTRCQTSSAADENNEISSYSNADCKRHDEMAEASRRREKWDSMWNIRYEELKKYVAEHGNSLVPTIYSRNESLGRWVENQRRQFKAGQLGNNPSEVILTNERISKLDEIGFVWDVIEAQWFERVEELRVYKRNYGDTLVPQDFSANPSLAHWVRNQRMDYALYHEKKAFEEKWGGVEVLDGKVKEEMERLTRRVKGMTKKRIQILESEGFVWDVFEYAWESQFQDLCDFVTLNGHAVIRRRRGGAYDPLARWVSTQRQNYKKYKNGQHTTLNEARIKRLDSIGFAWEVPHRMPKLRQSQPKRAGTL